VSAARSLRALAAAYGALSDYYGIHGLERARPEALVAVLKLLGAPIETIDDADSALRACREARRRRLLPPVVVLWDDDPRALPFRSRSGPDVASPDLTVTLALELENGATFESALAVSDLPVRFAKRGGVVRSLPLPDLPLGYHRVTLAAGGERVESVLVHAPRRAFHRDDAGRTREWGIFAPLYAARSRDSSGAGDVSDLARLTELAARNRAGFVATLPLFAAFVDEPSPYSPVTRLFWNELYVDPRLAPEWHHSEEAKRLLENDARSRTEAAEREALVDYRSLAAVKLPVLAILSRVARDRRPGALEAFVSERPLAMDYARFRAACERRSTPWPGWERAPLPGDLGDDLVLRHLYGQMLAETMLAETTRRAAASDVRLYFDLPLGVHPHGFDTWLRPSLFARGADVGAPPDAGFPDGQNWGFPPVHPEQSRQDGHLYLRRSLENAMRHAGALRIDHVMGLHRQYWIPAGFEKRDGVYVRYPFEELYAVANLESHRNRCELVGENLGIVPEVVNRELDRHRWRGIHVFQFSLTGRRDEPYLRAPESSAASLNTHDTPTFAGFCVGRDVDERVSAGLLDPQAAEGIVRTRRDAITVLDAALGLPPETPMVSRERLERWLALLLASEAEMVQVALEDLWLEEDPQNVPGRTDLPNWRRKLRYPIDALPAEVLNALARISRTDRAGAGEGPLTSPAPT
jgi:4-alpha-glucanotransferase